jgi:hypothetical protein
VPVVADERLRRLLFDLDDDRFRVRQKATAELVGLLESVETRLRRELEGRPSLEVRLRVERLLEMREAAGRSPERFRIPRALQVLEHAGTQDARQLLERLSRGAAETRLTQEARAALARLARQRNAKP